jgi:hypothetical protein
MGETAGAGAGALGRPPAGATGGRVLAASSCPLKPSAGIPRGRAWAFSETGAPSSAHVGLNSAYTHGRGTWTGGRGSGTICRQDTLADGTRRDIVLAVRGRATISPGITRLGRRGVGLALTVTVSASDSAACATGTSGTVTIFASYFQGHHDSVQLRFGPACSAESATFAGRALHALVANEGHQVNP